MSAFLDVVIALELVTAVWCLWRGRRWLRGTQMMAAWGAALLSVSAGGTVYGLTRFGIVPPPLHGHLWYGVAILFLAPPVFVLGARKPISRVWPWFVVLPLTCVLGFPSLTTLWYSGRDAPLHVDTPLLVGMALVLAMGAGGYLMTRFWLPAILYVTGVALLVLPWTDLGTGGISRLTVTAGLLSACLPFVVVWHQSRTTARELEPHQRLWADFRDTFGGLWAKRVMDRINWTAAEERWPARMDLCGLVWASNDVADEDRRKTAQRVEELLRWLLKRFVDDRWLRAREKV